MNRLTFDQPKHIDVVKTEYDIKRVSVLTTPNTFPMVTGLEFSGSVPALQKKYFPIKHKMDTHIEAYENSMLRAWNRAHKKLKAIKDNLKEVMKLDYNNAVTLSRIGKIPFRYKKDFVTTADKYDLNLAILDRVVMNPTLMVNARYDSRKNIMEFNPDYLEQHGMIRIGDSNDLISETAKTFIHEFGHAFWYNSLTDADRNYWGTLSSFFIRDQLTGDMDQYLVGEKKRFDGSTMYSPYYTLRDESFVSVYARFNVREDWAECYLYYKVAPKTLERINPKKYAFLEAKVGNRIEKDKLMTKQYTPDIKDPHKVKDEIVGVLDDLHDDLSVASREAHQRAYNLGRQKGAFYAAIPFATKFTPKDKERLRQLSERNDGYLDDFMDELNDEYHDVLFNKTPHGMVESIKTYEDTGEFDNAFEDVMDTQAHRLSLYAVNGLSLALMFGMIAESQTEFAGGYWHTAEDDKVCDGCQRLDGQWMSYDEFVQIYGDQDCDGNCRCGEIFEPALAPEGFAPLAAMVKGGQVSGRYSKGRGKGSFKLMKGGPGSGHHGHAGILGQRGGSATEGGSKKEESLRPNPTLRAMNAELKDKDLGSVELKMMPTADLQHGNPPTDETVQYLTENLRENSRIVPLLVSEDNTVLNGNNRLTVLSNMDATSVPVYVWHMESKSFADDSMVQGLDRIYEESRDTYPFVVRGKVTKSDKVVAVDYHGTIMAGNQLLPGIKEKLDELKASGHHIIIYTSGITANPSILNGIHEFLKTNQVPYDEIWQRQGKPDADVYIDDKSFNPNKEDIGTLEV